MLGCEGWRSVGEQDAPRALYSIRMPSSKSTSSFPTARHLILECISMYRAIATSAQGLEAIGEQPELYASCAAKQAKSRLNIKSLASLKARQHVFLL